MSLIEKVRANTKANPKHCRCGRPFETIFSQFICRCQGCERFEEATNLPFHFGPAALPIGEPLI